MLRAVASFGVPSGDSDSSDSDSGASEVGDAEVVSLVGVFVAVLVAVSVAVEVATEVSVLVGTVSELPHAVTVSSATAGIARESVR